MRTHGFPATALALLALSCASGEKETAKPAETRSTAPSITNDDLARATYRDLLEPEVTLVDGRWESPTRGAPRSTVLLLGDLTRHGDLDGDGAPEAVALLAAGGGGSGSFLYIAAMKPRDGGVENAATALVGDRVDVRDARVEDRQVILDVVQAGPEDALCCPGEMATRVWTLSGDSLAEGPSPVPAKRLSLEALGTGEWVLDAWNLGEPAPLAPPVTVLYTDGRIGGSSGCNRWSTTATTSDVPGDVALGPVNGTRMACADSVMAVEARFLDLLLGVRKYGFWNGKLALGYERHGTRGTMLFDRGAPRS
jgi:heat shock protein HslJ